MANNVQQGPLWQESRSCALQGQACSQRGLGLHLRGGDRAGADTLVGAVALGGRADHAAWRLCCALQRRRHARYVPVAGRALTPALRPVSRLVGGPRWRPPAMHGLGKRPRGLWVQEPRPLRGRAQHGQRVRQLGSRTERLLAVVKPALCVPEAPHRAVLAARAQPVSPALAQL